MRRFVLLCTVLLLSLCLLCGCDAAKPEPIHAGETYLDGAWYLEEGDLHVGYNLFPDGGGFLFIGDTVVPIRYGISDGYLYISDNGSVESLPFLEAEDGLWIDGLLYLPVAENPEAAASVEAMRSEAQQEQSAASSATPSQIGKTVMQLITLAAAVGVVVILVQFLRKRKKKA